MHTMLSQHLPVMQDWISSPEYEANESTLTVDKFAEVIDLLLERPNLNSSYLFRADILSDTAGKLRTISEKNHFQTRQGCSAVLVAGLAAANKHAITNNVQGIPMQGHPDTASSLAAPSQGLQPLDLLGFKLVRTVVRKLIPRRPKLDSPMDQSCFVYTSDGGLSRETSTIVVYVPHIASENDMPWYHPKVKAIAYQHKPDDNGGSISIHCLLFSQSHDAVSNRLHRTMMSLLQTFVRLSKLDAPTFQPASSDTTLPSAQSMTPAALKDTIIPQHIVQDTYTRLKETYASDLVSRWVEKTSPAKHVFEDLAIAAFLIELWNTMYENDKFPGFVDIACGNGVLVYILIKEGFSGYGFDARRRKTWEALNIDEHIEEKLCIPQPFLHVLGEDKVHATLKGISLHDGVFPTETFIISNHADELTLWTPILAMLTSTDVSRPFLAIPCCSHALSGAKKRYYPKDIKPVSIASQQHDVADEEDQPAEGDLKALRAQRLGAADHSDGKSGYACLTRKTVALAEELSTDIELTLIRIPSTRNIGVVGNRHLKSSPSADAMSQQIHQLIDRECSATGGLEASAQAWVERARKHLEGQGRGKVNLGRSPTEHDAVA